MNTTNTIIKPDKHKYLSFDQYEYIIREVTKHYARNKEKVRNTGRSALVKKLAEEMGASVSTIYEIIRESKITVQTSSLELKNELSSTAAFNRRTTKRSNYLKLEKADKFILLITKEIKDNPLSSVDEMIHYFKL